MGPRHSPESRSRGHPEITDYTSMCTFSRSPGTERHRVGPGAGGHHPSQTAQDRRHRAHQRAPRAAPAQLGLSLERPLRAGLPRPALLTGCTYSSDNHTSTGDAVIVRRSPAKKSTPEGKPSHALAPKPPRDNVVIEKRPTKLPQHPTTTPNQCL